MSRNSELGRQYDALERAEANRRRGDDGEPGLDEEDELDEVNFAVPPFLL